MVTIAPVAAEIGDIFEMPGVTMKVFVAVTVSTFVVTEICNELDAAGTVTVSEVVVAAVTVATISPNFTTFSEGTALNELPVIVTEEPSAPDSGVNEVITGLSNMVKAVGDIPVNPFAVTVNFPVTAPPGTTTTNWLAVALLMTALRPLKITEFSDLVSPKLLPEIVRTVPGIPLSGLKESIVGTGFGLSEEHEDKTIRIDRQ